MAMLWDAGYRLGWSKRMEWCRLRAVAYGRFHISPLATDQVVIGRRCYRFQAGSSAASRTMFG